MLAPRQQIRQRRQGYLGGRVKKAWSVLDLFDVPFLLKLNRTVVLTQITSCLAAQPRIRPPNVRFPAGFVGVTHLLLPGVRLTNGAFEIFLHTGPFVSDRQQRKHLRLCQA